MTSPEAAQPFTIRVEGEHAIVSSDDGATWELDPATVAQLRVIFEGRGRPSEELTAATAAGMGEASRVEPTGDIFAAAPAYKRTAQSVPLAAPERTAMTFGQVVDRRVSSRTLQPMDLPGLAGTLVQGARIRHVGPHGTTSRPAPSAGARHPCDLLVAAAHVDGLPAGWWWFDPWRCELHPATMDTSVDAYLTLVSSQMEQRSAPPVAIVAVADFRRTLDRYPAGSTLVWRDAGALLTVLQLAATEAGLGSCIVSASGQVQGLHGAVVTDVGALAVGRHGCD